MVVLIARHRSHYRFLIGLLAITACAKAPVRTEEPTSSRTFVATFRSTAELVKDPELAAKVDLLGTQDEIQTSHIGQGTPSKTYALFEEIVSVSSKQQILALLQHQRPVVRGYALMHVQTYFSDDIAALGPLLSDEIEVDFLFADMGTRYRVCELAFQGLSIDSLTRLRAAIIPVARNVGRGCWGEALRGLGMLQDQSVAAIAEPLLGNADPKTVRYAIEALELANVTTSAARIRMLESSPHAITRGDVASALGRFRSAEAEPVLRRLIDDSDPFVRGCALESYAQQAGRDLAILQTALKSGDSDIRLRVEVGLAKDARLESLTLLGQRIESGQESSYFWQQLERALANKDLRLDALMALMRSLQENPKSASAADRVSTVLFAACDKACLPMFRERLQHGNEDEQRRAASAVGRLVDRQSIPQLRSLLQAADPYTRVAAARALLKLKVHAAIPEIEQAAAPLPDERLGPKVMLRDIARDLRKLPTSGR